MGTTPIKPTTPAAGQPAPATPTLAAQLTAQRADRITVAAAALKTYLTNHGSFASHLVTDAIMNEAATICIDSDTNFLTGKVI